MGSTNKIALKTAHNLALSNLLLSRVFAFPLTFPYLTPHLFPLRFPRFLNATLPPPFLNPLSPYSLANYAAKLKIRESLHPVVSVEY